MCCPGHILSVGLVQAVLDLNNNKNVTLTLKEVGADIHPLITNLMLKPKKVQS
jgi:hypothetical protein